MIDTMRLGVCRIVIFGAMLQYVAEETPSDVVVRLCRCLQCPKPDSLSISTRLIHYGRRVVLLVRRNNKCVFHSTKLHTKNTQTLDTRASRLLAQHSMRWKNANLQVGECTAFGESFLPMARLDGSPTIARGERKAKAKSFFQMVAYVCRRHTARA